MEGRKISDGGKKQEDRNKVAFRIPKSKCLKCEMSQRIDVDNSIQNVYIIIHDTIKIVFYVE